MLSFLFTAALFGLRKGGKAKNPEQWAALWAIHKELGCPPLPITAKWVQR